MKTSDIEASVAPLLEEALKLEKEAKELRSLAKEVESRLIKIAAPPVAIQAPDTTKEITQDLLIAAIRRKGGRVKHYAVRLGTTEKKIIQLIENSNGMITIGKKGWIVLS